MDKEDIMPAKNSEERKKFSIKLIIPWLKEKPIRWIAMLFLLAVIGFFALK